MQELKGVGLLEIMTLIFNRNSYTIRLMIKENKENKVVKAVGLMSGGLDSSLACKIIKDLGVEVYGVYFAMPWGCCDKKKAMESAEEIGIHFITLQLDERYLEIVRKPKHGYGTALNPCRDCRIHMFSRAGQYMRHIGADFVFTGEVAGQRPMSQKRNIMRCIERDAGLEGRLLRPLCAQLMEPTIVEEQGLVDRTKLLSLNGRSRSDQYALAEKLNITKFSAPAGGCALTDPNFANRMKDTLKYGYRNFRETIGLKWGRHFRINADFKIVIGRDSAENDSLIEYAHLDDYILQLPKNDGPTAILKGACPSESILAIAAALIQRYSKYKSEESIKVNYWPVKDRNNVQSISSHSLLEDVVERMRV